MMANFFSNLYGIVVSRDSSLIELLSHVETLNPKGITRPFASKGPSANYLMKVVGEIAGLLGKILSLTTFLFGNE